MPRKKKSKQYFTLDTEEAIIEYNKTKDQKIRNKLYEERIKYPFEKLAENILNTFSLDVIGYALRVSAATTHGFSGLQE